MRSVLIRTGFCVPSVVIALLLGVVATGCTETANTQSEPPIVEKAKKMQPGTVILQGPTVPVDLIRVIDGDTIVVRLPDSREERVRYIGIDAPESVHPEKPVEPFALEASSRNRELVEGRSLLLELDVQERDQYGRLLAFVWADGEMVNLQLVREGLAWVTTYPPNVRHVEALVEAQRHARRDELGVWSEAVE